MKTGQATEFILQNMFINDIIKSQVDVRYDAVISYISFFRLKSEGGM